MNKINLKTIYLYFTYESTDKGIICVCEFVKPTKLQFQAICELFPTGIKNADKDTLICNIKAALMNSGHYTGKLHIIEGD